MRCVRVIVRGMVQGVGYRYSARLAAESAGVSGWIRNLDDGTVEARLEGTAEQVDEMLEWMRRGPQGADVHDVEASDEEPTGLSGFRVLTAR